MKRLAAAIGIALVTSGILHAQDAARDKIIYTRQKAFKIPFQIPDPAEAKQLKEVQLYVSRDGGSWEKYTSAPPDVPAEKRSFVFRADREAEYTFAVRTLDRQGNFNPPEESELEVGLHVVVDSQVPIIELGSIRTRGSQVGVAWEVKDSNVDLKSFIMEYRTGGQADWQPVPGLTPKMVGRVTWVPQAPGDIVVRCQVKDRANNLGIEQIELPAPVGSNPVLPEVPDQPRRQVGRDDEESTWPSFGEDDHGAAPSLPSARSGGRFGSNPSRLPADPRGVPDQGGSDFDSVRQTNSLMGRAGLRDSIPVQGGASLADRQLVRHPEISIDYQIDEVGPSDVSLVELWVTSDTGQTWRRFGEDADRTSPFDVNLGGDGLYGLTMLAKNGIGLGPAPPRPGDPPQSWVEVDSTPARVRLSRPEIGSGPEAGGVIITWKAEDRNLGPRPVSLFYRGSTGEWKRIATDIANTGKYFWKLDSGAPFRFHVAIEVVDRAGNRQMAESSEVVLDSSRPRPRIMGIKSLPGYRR